MTRFVFTFVTIAAVLATAEHASAHGFQITVDPGDKLQLTSEDPTAGSQLIYKVQSLIGPSTARGTDHPGYEAVSGFSSGDKIYFDILGPLWYSSGSGSPVHAVAGVSLSITPQDLTITGSATASGSTGFLQGFLIGEYDGVALGAYEHQLLYELDDAAGVPTGAFAVAMRLRNGLLSEPALYSDPFVAVFNNGLSIATLETVGPQLFTAAVPEPSGMILIAMASLGLIALGRRWSGRHP